MCQMLAHVPCPCTRARALLVQELGDYGAKLSAAQDLITRLGNDNRDEDRGGPSGFEDKAARARRFAAEMALQSYALRAAAEGAALAYAEVTGGAARVGLFSCSFPPSFIAGGAGRRGDLLYIALSDSGVTYRFIQDCAPRSRRATLCA